MSDQDFFFDEDEPKPSPKGTSKGAGPAKGSTVSKTGAKAPAAVAAPAGTSIMDRSITVAVAALVAVIGLLVGVILGFFLGQSSVVAPAVGTVSTPPATSAGGASPAPLTPEQLNQGLPTGHVPIGGAATSTPATTP